jgi:DNA polymerase-3 subunit gamma/tau
MSQKYQVIARRYRPQRFSEVVGQEAILQTLKNALRRDVAAHAYLFTGSRGVGKTTLARLFAKALNCTARTQDEEPCNQCPSCLDISSGQALDVIEIDGASHRGINDIRQINETVGFVPGHGKYKIYLIDEVHMLTKEAFNALLKTLEEPPPTAKFFFATTEPHKVLSTIVSRCQRFDLGRLLPAQIISKLQTITADLNRSVDLEALHLIAACAEGSLRDAESLLDQILCYTEGAIFAKEVQKVLGLVPKDLFFAFDRAFAESRFPFAFELVESLFQSGKDLSHFLSQLIEHFRHLLVSKTIGTSTLFLTAEFQALYGASARLYTQSQCFAILDLLLKTEQAMARAASQRVTLELSLLQALRIKNRIPVEVLVRRLEELEEVLKKEAPASTAKEESVEPPPLELPSQVSEELPPTPIELKAVPFQIPEPIAPAPVPPSPTTPVLAAPAPSIEEIKKAPLVSEKPQSHYDTLMRFAAVELEGTLKL